MVFNFKPLLLGASYDGKPHRLCRLHKLRMLLGRLGIQRGLLAESRDSMVCRSVLFKVRRVVYSLKNAIWVCEKISTVIKSGQKTIGWNEIHWKFCSYVAAQVMDDADPKLGSVTE